jgi:trans-aconitate 2-methyltransferase
LKLINRFPEANITGLDQSPGMLAAAKLRLPHVDFEQIDLTHWRPGRPYDVIFASASLQWLPDHEALFPRLASSLTVGGCLAVQMPDTVQEPIRALMRMVAAGGSWTAKLMPVATSRPRIGSIKDYYGFLATHFSLSLIKTNVEDFSKNTKLESARLIRRKLTAKFTFPFQRCSSSPDAASEPRW